VTLIYEGKLTIGALIAANMLASRILSPLGNIVMTIARGQQALTALGGIRELMQLPRDKPPKLGLSPKVLSPEIEFRRVTFSYPGQDLPALNRLSCRIRTGERVGIVGKVGSGKTTMGRLMAGLYLPSEGAVLISDADTRSYDPAELRAGVGFVAQDPELFSGTLRENITLGLQTATDQAIAAVVGEVGLADLIKSHPAGLQMEVGERGRNLSGGQRQAVALARILIRNPKVLFLDEPSSALDSQSEQALIRTLLRWSEGDNRTLVVCSHRLGMLNLASRVLVISEGQVTADGPRDEILAKLGATAKSGAG
jgi:ATP-binding cassette subfamily C protein LapB